MKVISNPNDEQLSAWAGWVNVESHGGLNMYEAMYQAICYGRHGYIYWADDWPDLEEK